MLWTGAGRVFHSRIVRLVPLLQRSPTHSTGRCSLFVSGPTSWTGIHRMLLEIAARHYTEKPILREMIKQGEKRKGQGERGKGKGEKGKRLKGERAGENKH